MTGFTQPDLVPLWDRPPEFLPLRPPPGIHRWSFRTVRAELDRLSPTLDKASTDRRVALLAHPDLADAAATDGLHVGVQMLLAGESAAAHRHTPAALRIGIEATDIVTTVDGEDVPFGPLDVVLNPSGTWHGHYDRGDTGAIWLDVVDLPLVTALGGVLFEPTRAHQSADLLDPPWRPATCSYPWSTIEPELASQESVDGVQSYPYGDGAVLQTIGVTAYALEHDATLVLGRRTGGSVVLAARGSFDSTLGVIDQSDVVALRSWTPLSLTVRSTPGVVMVIDTAPALRALGLYREEPPA